MHTIEAARETVVVGVDDTSVSRSAVMWAAEEARLRGLHLLIVHVGVTIDQIDPTSVAALGNALTGCQLAILGYRHNGLTKSRAVELADGFRRQATCPLLFPSDHVNGSWRAP